MVNWLKRKWQNLEVIYFQRLFFLSLMITFNHLRLIFTTAKKKIACRVANLFLIIEGNSPSLRKLKLKYVKWFVVLVDSLTIDS